MIDNNMDRFGYYTVNDLKFYSRLEAAEVKRRLNITSPIVWHFNDEVFSSHNWTEEPAESLSDLYKQRAQQLRDKYDYIVLWFSGGADSTNVLNSFINNGIKIDEIAHKVNYEATGDKCSFLNGEIYNVAIPKVKEAQIVQPWIRHTVIDLSAKTLDLFNQDSTKFDWVYQMNSFPNPNNYTSKDLKTSQPHWRNLIAAGKKVCFLHGIDKPYVAGINGQFSFWFTDMVDLASSPGMQIANIPGHFDELFYWTPDCPKIVIKQAHELKKVLKTLNDDSKMISREKDGTAYIMHRNRPLYFKLNGIHQVIYPGWYPVPYQMKPQSLIFTPRDEWFFKLPDSDPAKQAWKIGIQHLWDTLPAELRISQNKMADGFKSFKSKIYNIGT